MRNEQLEILKAEYNNSCAEYLEILSEYRKQINLLNYYITVFTGVIIVLFYTLKETNSIGHLQVNNEYIFVLTLTFSISLLYYIYSNAIDIVYNLYLVEAKRAALEQRINTIVSDANLLNWDNKVVRHFNETFVHKRGWLNPSILTGVASGSIVIVITVIHCVLAFLLIPTLDFRIYFTITACLISSFLLQQFVTLHLSGKKYIFDYVYAQNAIQTHFTKTKFSVLYFAIFTFIVGPLAFIIWSIEENAFWPGSSADFPFLLVWPLSVGDVLLLPIINYKIGNLALNFLEQDELKRNRKALINSSLGIFLLAALSSILSHYAWATDRYTDFISMTPGVMTPGGWWHFVFSIAQTFAFAIFFVFWFIAVKEKNLRAIEYAKGLWWWIFIFLSLMIVNSLQQYTLVFDRQGVEVLISAAFAVVPLLIAIVIRLFVSKDGNEVGAI